MGKGALRCDNEGLRGPHCQQNRSTFPMRKSTGPYPSLIVDTTAKRVVSHAGSVHPPRPPGRSAWTGNFPRRCGRGSGHWPSTTPGRFLDMAISVAIGGDCLADIAQVRAEPALFGHVAKSDPTVSRLIDTLAVDAPPAWAAINTARA